MRSAELIEVGGRDGLQNESSFVESTIKLDLFKKLISSGLSRLEATSFVSPKWIPQMSDASTILEKLQKLKLKSPNIRFSVLIPNLKGWETALSVAKPDEILIFTAASEIFCQKNINCSIAESIERFAPVVKAARDAGIAVRGAMSCTVGCPYEGDIAPERVAYLAGLMKSIGIQRVDVADTIGVGTPRKVQAAMEATLKHYALNDVSGHFHDTYGQALANTLASLEMGVWNFQSSIAGLGGCPYAKGATGNVATEDVVYMMQGMGIDTGIDLDALIDAGLFISQALGRQPNSLVARAVLNKRAG